MINRSNRIKLISLFLVVVVSSQMFLSARADSGEQNDHTAEIDLPILMYHEVKYNHTGKDTITPYEFESDLKYLKKNGFTTIGMSDLISYVYDDKPLPKNPIILSFDDGYLNNYYYVYPLLKKYNARIVLSVIGRDTDNFTKSPDKNLDYSHMTWGQINEMIQSGHVDIQNHTYNLHKITCKRYGCQRNKGESLSHYEQILTEDLGKLQQEIQENTGIAPNTFAYPYGQVSEESVPIIKKLGFKASLSCLYGINIITRDKEELYGLRRICRSHGDVVGKVLKDAMKTLKYRRRHRAQDT